MEKQYSLKKILRRLQKFVETVRLPLKLEAQQFDLIFTCRKTFRGNLFLAGVRYVKDMLVKRIINLLIV